MRSFFIVLAFVAIAVLLYLTFRKDEPAGEKLIHNYYRATLVSLGDTILVDDTTGKPSRIGDTVFVMKLHRKEQYYVFTRSVEPVLNGRMVYDFNDTKKTGPVIVTHRRAVIIK